MSRSMQQAVLQKLQMTHLGIKKIKQLAQSVCSLAVDWQGHWEADGERMSSLYVSVKRNPPKVPLHLWLEPAWEQLAASLQEHYFLVMINATSKWAKIFLCSSAPTFKSTVHLLLVVFAREGFPDVVVSDGSIKQSMNEQKTLHSSNNVRTKCSFNSYEFRWRWKKVPTRLTLWWWPAPRPLIGSLEIILWNLTHILKPGTYSDTFKHY